jgi:hypothetical protein
VSIAVQPAARATRWRFAVIGVVALLAAGIGVALGAFLVAARVAGVGTAAEYVPANAVFYAELRVQPSTTQDASLRELLGHFPAIDEVDLGRPLYDQLIERIDEGLAGEETDLRWATDVAPWFDGSVAVAITDIPASAMAPVPFEGPMTDPTMPMMMPELPSGVVMIGVTDRDAAASAIDRLLAEADDAPTFTETEHDGVTIHALGTDSPGAWALTSDQLIFGFAADDISDALDARDGETLAEAEEMDQLIAALPNDWLGLAVYDYTDVMAEALSQADAGTGLSDTFAALLEGQPLRGAATISVSGDRVSFDSASDAPSGAFAVTNADRGLSDEVPADALYYSEGGNIGASLAAIIGPMKEAAAAESPEVADQIETAESALGAEIEDLVSWIGDGAMVIGADAGTPYGGLLLVPTDVDAAERRLGQLSTFAGLAGLDPSSGVTVEESEIAGETVTTIRWDAAGGDPMLGMPFGVVVQFTVTDDRAVIGFGEGFVERVLELEPSESLGSQDRYTDAVASLGGSDNSSVAWVDLAGIREAIETATGAGDDEAYAADVLPWLAPIDALASVGWLEGDLLVQHAALILAD